MPPLPSLSVVMFTNGPIPIVAASLRRVRAIAEEIVVAVDHRVPVEALGPLEGVADKIIRSEFAYPLEANLDWLHQQATGDWILRLDSDDVVSEALLRRLSTPGWDAGITHAYLQYRWLWGSPDSMIDQAPWWPDPALRLIRNLPGIATFPKVAHEPAVVAGSASIWDVALYHLDLLLADEETRASKALGYELHAPGHRTDRGWSVSSTYYLPERLRPTPHTAAVPAVDATVVAQVLEAGRTHADAAPPRDLAALGPVVTLADRRTPPPVADDARVRIVGSDPIFLIAGRSTIVTVAVANRTAQVWRASDDPPHQIGGRITDDAGAPVGPELRGPLTGDLHPGEEALVRLVLPGGLGAEATRLDVGVVQDGVAWHDASASARLVVVRGRRVLLSTGVSTFPHLGDDLITREVLVSLARHLPDVVPVLLAHPTDGLAERFGCTVAAGPSALPAPTGRGGESGRRGRDLVSQARLMSKGEIPSDPVVEAILRPFAEASALVLAPGGGLASRYSDDALKVYAVQVLVARAFGLPVLLEAPSIGPIETRRDHAALAELLNDATRITVRDPASADAARRIGRAIDPEVVPDIATAMLGQRGPHNAAARAWLDARNVPEDRPYVVISLRGGTRDADHLDTVREAVAKLPEHTALIYLPHCTEADGHDDLEILRDDEWAGAALVPWDTSLGDLAAVALVSGASMTIGTRFHLSVLANAAGVPAVSLLGDEYDRLRLRGLQRQPGVRVVEVDDPAGAAAATVQLLAGEPLEPAARWDGAAFAEALAAVLPPVPRLA